MSTLSVVSSCQVTCSRIGRRITPAAPDALHCSPAAASAARTHASLAAPPLATAAAAITAALCTLPSGRRLARRSLCLLRRDLHQPGGEQPPGADPGATNHPHHVRACHGPYFFPLRSR